MLRSAACCCLLLLGPSLLPAASALAPGRAMPLAQVSGDDLVLPEDGLHVFEALVNMKGKPVIVGGYGHGDGLSTLFNAVSAAGAAGKVQEDEQATSVSGLPTGEVKQPAVWLMNSGKVTKDGREILFLTCEACNGAYLRTRPDLKTKLFSFVHRLSHHLVVHSQKVGAFKAERLAALLQHAAWVDLSSCPTDADGNRVPALDDAADAHKTLAGTPVTWVGTGTEKALPGWEAVVAQAKVFGEAAEQVAVRALPMPFASASASGLRLATLADFDPVFLTEASAALAAVAEKRHERDLPAVALFAFFRRSLDEVVSNHVPAAGNDLSALLRSSLEDRKASALGLYANLLGHVARGDRRSIARVLPGGEPQYAGVLDAVEGGRSAKPNQLLARVLEVSRESDTPEAEAAAALAVAPASHAMFVGGAKSVWILSVQYFANGFGGVTQDDVDVGAVRGALHNELAGLKKDAVARHTEDVKAYLAGLARVARHAAGTYHAVHKISDVCSPQVEEAVRDELVAGVASLFATAQQWWPAATYDTVVQEEAATKAAVEHIVQERTKRSSALIDAAGAKMALARKESFDGSCDLPIEKPGAAGLRSVCETGLKDALAGFDADVESIVEGECRGQWIHKHPSVETARAALAADLEERKHATLSENDARVGRECRKTSEGYVHEAATAFTKIADGDVPDEAALDRSAAELLGGAGRAILAVWQPWDGEVVAQCVAQTAAAIEDELQSAKVRVELRLFGSDEMRAWREEWVASLDGQLAGCFVCRVHSHFLQAKLRELALATMPREIAGSPVSEGFRNGIATKAVNVENARQPRTADLEIYLYLTVVLLIGAGAAIAFLA